MILLSLFACVLLGALSAQARIVPSFRECSHFFYKGQEPTGMDQNAKKICQRFEYKDSFATLYSVSHRIPVYSAYTFDGSTEDCKDGRRPSQWLIEPQISTDNTENMSSEKKKSSKVIKIRQAINDDYKYTGYDRGHLNPNCFQKDNGSIATFTLTNTAPMDPNFNHVQWMKWETKLEHLLSMLDTQIEATAYLVSGTVPNPNNQIPQRVQINGGATYETERVSVPTHVWTALCYANRDERQSFSFGYIGENKADGVIMVMSVIELNARLGDLYGSSVSIFADDCFSNNISYNISTFPKEIIEKLKIEIPVKQGLQNLSDTQNTPYSRKRRATEQFFNLNNYFQRNEQMKKYNNKACLIISTRSKSVECWVVPEKSSAEGMTTADGTHCRSGLRYCETESGFKPCCTSPCLYQAQRRDFWCYSGDTSIPCSPQYSLITIGGEQCKDDHSCATYGLDYYWCETSWWSWDYCSPPLPDSIAKNQEKCRINHACGKYGKNYYWCYTDYNNNWDYCCTHNDRFSAVDGKTCKPNHPCGYYGEDYLWCYTTDDEWDYCCVGV